jgi:hypothetical protein
MRLETSMNHKFFNFIFKYIALKGNLITHGKSFPICQASKLKFMQPLKLLLEWFCYLNGWKSLWQFGFRPFKCPWLLLQIFVSENEISFYYTIFQNISSSLYETSQFEQCLIPKLGPNYDSNIQNYKLPKNENPFENVEASYFASFHTCEVSLNLNQGCLGLFYWNENVESKC